jgi:hypothetical protein
LPNLGTLILERLLERCFVRNRYDFSMLSEVFGKRTFSVHLSSNCGNRHSPGRAFVLVLLRSLCTTTTHIGGIGRR